MAINLMDNVLLPEHRAAGLSLNEDDHSISLVFDGKAISFFKKHVPITEIWNAAYQFVEETKSGISFERVGK